MLSQGGGLPGPERSDPAPAPDWRPAFAAAGLDYAAFAARTVPAQHQPPLAADARFAWIGPYPSSLVTEVRVEAASLRGQPVYFAVEFPWQADEHAAAYPTYEFPPHDAAGLFFLFGLPLLAAGLAAWNWRSGRADLIGAAKLSGVLFGLWFVRWALAAHHVADSRESVLLMEGLGLAAFHALLLAVFYLALEPAVRKRWPRRLVSWNRLLAGRLRDPLVGGDVLVGLAAGTGISLIVLHVVLGPVWAPELLMVRMPTDLDLSVARSILNPLTTGIRVGLSMYFLYFLIQSIARNRWLGIAGYAAAFTALMLGSGDHPKPVTGALTTSLSAVGLALVARQFGLLAFMAATVAYGWLFVNDWTLDFKSWYAAGPALGIAILLLLTVWSALHRDRGRILGRTADDEN